MPWQLCAISFNLPHGEWHSPLKVDRVDIHIWVLNSVSGPSGPMVTPALFTSQTNIATTNAHLYAGYGGSDPLRPYFQGFIFSLGLRRFSRNNDPWKEWGRYPMRSELVKFKSAPEPHWRSPGQGTVPLKGKWSHELLFFARCFQNMWCANCVHLGNLRSHGQRLVLRD